VKEQSSLRVTVNEQSSLRVTVKEQSSLRVTVKEQSSVTVKKQSSLRVTVKGPQSNSKVGIKLFKMQKRRFTLLLTEAWYSIRRALDSSISMVFSFT
jgi:hypothetical protein